MKKRFFSEFCTIFSTNDYGSTDYANLVKTVSKKFQLPYKKFFEKNTAMALVDYVKKNPDTKFKITAGQQTETHTEIIVTLKCPPVVSGVIIVILSNYY